ncbi:DNRLRE domain-containing protein [Aeromicrobium yanjiei]
MKQDSDWVDVDYTLTKQPDGSWAPKAAPVDVSINGGSPKEAARVTFDDGESVAVTWPQNLPEPTVSGGVATYKLSNATDLLLAVTSNGVNAHLRLNQEPAADDPVFTFGLRAEGVEVDQTKSGGLEISGDDGETIAETSNLVAWDDNTDYAGDPANVVNLDATLVETTTTGDVTQHTLDLTTPNGFLSDPDTQYPVIIDPDLGMSRTRDTFVRSGDTTDHGSENRLIVGKIDPSVSSNSNPTRSYLKFYNGTIEDNPNVEVLSAKLGLYQYYGYSCSDRRMYAYPVGTPWDDNITWANKPDAVAGGYSTYVDDNRGAAGCGDGWTTMNVTNMAKAWNTGAVDMQGLRLHAEDEDRSSYERRFCSMNPQSGTSCNTAAKTPYLSVTYGVYTQAVALGDLAPSVSVGDELSASALAKAGIDLDEIPQGGAVLAETDPSLADQELGEEPSTLEDPSSQSGEQEDDPILDDPATPDAEELTGELTTDPPASDSSTTGPSISAAAAGSWRLPSTIIRTYRRHYSDGSMQYMVVRHGRSFGWTGYDGKPKKAFGWQKGWVKHNARLASVKATLKYGKWNGAEKRFQMRASKMLCSTSWWGRKSCKVVDTMLFRVVYEYGAKRQAVGDPYSYGVVTSYCVNGSQWCPSWVNEAARKYLKTK